MKLWIKAGLFWALWMFIIMTFAAPYVMVWIGLQDESEPKFPIAKIIINAIIFTIGGFIFGYWTFERKKRSKKQIDE
ncbi:hypothetical protein ACX0HA_07650 [Flavobacterium hauense]